MNRFVFPAGVAVERGRAPARVRRRVPAGARLALGLIIALGSAANAHADSPLPRTGAVLYGACAGCHGAQGQGDPAQGAPNIAGLDADYVERQLRHFAAGLRGGTGSDSYAARMRAGLAAALSGAPDAAYPTLAAYVSRLPPVPAPAGADAQRSPAALASGRNYYNAICSACHGSKGLGNAALGAPRLAGTDGAYLRRQLAAFRSGVRGTHPDDVQGAQMRRMLLGLPGPQTDRDILAYIAGLAPAPAAGTAP